jgi:transcriptional regulator with GAF, ATPase, and Fis domain
VKGSFTGAHRDKPGKFEFAHTGTLFLDEVGEMTLRMQGLLLRVLETGELQKVGAGRWTARVDARVIAATNRDLQEEVRRGAFRADLFFRLNVFPIWVPPLRDRREDIPILAQHFVREFAGRLGRQVDRIDSRAVDNLLAYDWPGNVRELANILERAVILCRSHVLERAHLALPSAPLPRNDDLLTLEEAERRHILKALEKTGGVLGGPNGAARLLGLNRSTLWSRMRKLGIEPV